MPDAGQITILEEKAIIRWGSVKFTKSVVLLEQPSLSRKSKDFHAVSIGPIHPTGDEAFVFFDIYSLGRKLPTLAET